MQNDVSTMSLFEEQDGPIALLSSSPTFISMPSPDAPEQTSQDQKATHGSYKWFLLIIFMHACCYNNNIIIMRFKCSTAPEPIPEPVLDVSTEIEPIALTVKRTAMASLHAHDDVRFCVISL